jgi:hypothetical protein
MAAGRNKMDARTAASLKVVVSALNAKTLPPDAIRELLTELIAAAKLDYDQRMDAIGGALVSEAVRPFWEAGLSPDESHRRLRERDPELADVIEALAPVLLSRAEGREDALKAVAEVESLFDMGQRPLL